ncbi:MAG: RNA polymerase sigma factor [candidate division Zixibacteria bacterium]|nr:RNA polymerase sigma factor [candidate division Zixibacteria bacterium]
METGESSLNIGQTEAAPGLVPFANDYSLAREIAAGNREVFRELYDKNATTLYNLARRMIGSTDEAEDIVQETFIRAYRKINLFGGRSSLSSWLYRICINIGLEHLRRKKGVCERLDETNCGAVEPDQKQVMLRRKLDKAIKHLPQGCRMVFVLHDIEGLNHKEIADRLQLSEGTSKSQLFKARAMLRKILTGRESGSDV